MLVLFRILFTGLFLWLLASAARQAQGNLGNDLGNAGSFALAVVIGVAAGITWAPVLGETVAGPMTGLMTDGSVSDDRAGLLRFIRRCEMRGWRRLTVLLAFWECVLRPRLPAAYVIGMNNARPGSWLEKVFAKEVWRFNNIANCVRAHDLLKLRHDLDPGAHPEPGVNLALMSHLRVPNAELPPLPVPVAPPAPPPPRNHSIQLFPGADAVVSTAPAPDEPRPAETEAETEAVAEPQTPPLPDPGPLPVASPCSSSSTDS